MKAISGRKILNKKLTTEAQRALRLINKLRASLCSPCLRVKKL